MIQQYKLYYKYKLNDLPTYFNVSFFHPLHQSTLSYPDSIRSADTKDKACIHDKMYLF